MKKAPLAGIRIVELGQLLAVPFAARMLADLGAEVIKVESPLRLDSYRKAGFPNNEPGENYWDRGGTFYNENRGKLGVTLDLRVPDARAVFRDLVRVSDVVMENYSAHVMTKFGLDYDSLRQVKPDLIMLSSTGYGHTGPWADFGAANPATEGASGLAAITGYVDGPPVLPDIPHTDYVAAEQGVLAILLALFRRRQTGSGTYIDLSQVEAQASVLGEQYMDAAANRTAAAPQTNRSPAMAPHGIFPCRGNDRWIAIAVPNDDAYHGLIEAMGEPDWARGAQFATNAGRLSHASELEQHLNEWTRLQDAMDLMHLLQSHGVPAGAVLDSRDLVVNSHLRARGFFHWLDHPEASGIGAKPYPGAGWHFSQSEHGVKRRAPAFGEHNQEVLRDILSYDEARVAEVIASGALGDSPDRLPRPTPEPLSLLLERGHLLEIDPEFEQRIKQDRT